MPPVTTMSVSVSIITPCYNGARFLPATLDSAIGQTVPPCEIIVIDDGSTDDSAAIAAARGEPVRVIRQANQGESVARNRGLAEARGTHVLFLDADDLLMPESLQHLTAAVNGHAHAVAVMGCAWFRESPDDPYADVTTGSINLFPDLITDCFLPPHCWLVPLDLVRRVGGFHEPLRAYEDWDLWWRIALEEPQLLRVGYVGGRYRRHPGSQVESSSSVERTRGHLCLMERMAAGMLARRRFVDRFGSELFWACWTAVRRGMDHQLPWPLLEPLGNHLHELARIGPPQLRRSLTARAIRALGPRLAMRLQKLAG